MDDRSDGAAAANQDPRAHVNGNPLLAPGRLPEFEALRAEHVEPAINAVLAAQRAALERAERAAEPTLDWLARSRADRHRDSPRVGARLTSELRALEPGAARRVQPLPAARDRVLHRSRAERGAVSPVRQSRAARGRRAASGRGATDLARAAGLPLERRDAHGRAARAFPRDHAAARGAPSEVRAEPHGRDGRVPASRARPRSARGAAGGRARAGPRAGGRAPARRVAAAARRADLSVRARARRVAGAARALLRGVGHARVGPRPECGAGRQRAADRGDPRAAPRERALARLRELRRAFARDQDGRYARARDRVPARSRAAQQGGRRARARGVDRVRGPARSSRGTSRSIRSVCARSGCGSPRKSCGLTSRCRACSTGCSRS